MRVVVSRPLPGGLGLLEQEHSITDLWVSPDSYGVDRRAFLEQLSGAHAAIVTVSERVDAEFFEAAGPDLRVVANYAVGFDNMSIAEATGRKVWLTNTPDAVTPSTADMAWTLMLGVSRRVHEGEAAVRSGAFANTRGFDPSYLLGGDFEGQTLHIVGAGRIGFAVAMRSLGWSMRVLYTSRTEHPEFEKAPLRAERVRLEDGLRQADYVSIHVPLTEETRHLIGEAELRMMKSSAYLINTARGPVVDETALVRALRNGWIAGAGLDVYEDEPRTAPGLIELENTLLMPHVGSASRRQRPLMAEMAQRNVVAVLRGNRPPNPINEPS
ncbi:MAG: 2-hydroxyacid dehydrogenase [Phycisphaerales bacterium]